MAKELFDAWDDELQLCITAWKAKYRTGIIDERDLERARIIDFWSGTPVAPLSLQDMLRYIQEDVELGQGKSDVSAEIANLLAAMTRDVELSDTGRARLEKFTALAIQLGMAYEQFLLRRDRELADYGAKRRDQDKKSARSRQRISENEAYKLCEAIKRENPDKSDRWISNRAHIQLKAKNREAAPAAETIRKKWHTHKTKPEIPW